MLRLKSDLLKYNHFKNIYCKLFSIKKCQKILINVLKELNFLNNRPLKLRNKKK
ncbi:hypothetical protein OC709_02170 ['Planchonia careya' phytoplasma]|nr:hypothetical protein ['Planchonia careya' phytoplasma]MDO8030304.1 hypothetical protein ['Planchonia careya' phytoplasma]